MKTSWIKIVTLLVGAAAACVALSSRFGWSATAPALQQYCTDTYSTNEIQPIDDLVRRAGAEGWDLVGVYRSTRTMGGSDYVCFRRAPGAGPGAPVVVPRSR